MSFHIDSNDLELARLWLLANEERIVRGDDSMLMLEGMFRAIVGRSPQ